MKKIKKIYEKIFTGINALSLKYFKVNYHNSLCIRGKMFLKNNNRNYGAITIGKNVVINSSVRANPVSGGLTKIYAMTNGKIQIGNNVGLSNCSIISNHSIRILDDVMIGAGTIIMDTDFHAIDYKDRMHDILYEESDKCSVIIDKGVFIGANCIILKGVHIGEYSVIGAGSVVTKSIPSNEVWAGNPAKLVKRIV